MTIKIGDEVINLRKNSDHLAYGEICKVTAIWPDFGDGVYLVKSVAGTATNVGLDPNELGDNFDNYEAWRAAAEHRGFFIDEGSDDEPGTHLATDQPGDEEPANYNVVGEFTVLPDGHMGGWLQK